MGVFVSEEGHYQGWLAGFLCCCAAVGHDEHPIEREKATANASTASSICNQQPSPLVLSSRLSIPALAELDGSAPDNGLHPGYAKHDLPTRPLPSLKPLDIASKPTHVSPITTPTPNPPQQIDRSAGHTRSSSRRRDQSEPGRHSLVPLKLAPVVLRAATEYDQIPRPLASHSPLVEEKQVKQHRSDSTQRPSTFAQSGPYVDNNETPFQRSLRQSVDLPMRGRPSQSRSLSRDDGFTSAAPHAERPKKPTLSQRASSPSLRHRAMDYGPSSSHTSRSSSEASRSSLRLKHKHSWHHGDDPGSPVDKDLIELNTIVEERRAEKYRAITTDRHVPAVAPSMEVGARSETLTDIGSALSRPLTAKKSSDFNFESRLHDNDRPSRARSTQANKNPRARSSTRLSNWLTGIVTPNSNFDTVDPIGTTVVPARARGNSHSSSVTALDPPSLTAASSPTSKGHSRSQTAESHPGPLVNPYLLHESMDTRKPKDQHVAIMETERKCDEEGWPSLAPIHRPNDVGRAL